MDRPCSDVQCKAAGYPLHSHLSPELPLPHVTVCHQVPNGLYLRSLLFRAGIKSLPPPATLMAVWPFKGLTVRHIYIYICRSAPKGYVRPCAIIAPLFLWPKCLPTCNFIASDSSNCVGNAYGSVICKPYMYGLQITFVFNNVFPEDDSLRSKHVEGIIKQSKRLTDHV